MMFSRTVAVVCDTSLRKDVDDPVGGSEPSTEEDPADIPIREWGGEERIYVNRSETALAGGRRIGVLCQQR